MTYFQKNQFLITTAFVAISMASQAHAANFTVSNGQTVGGQALTGANTGLVQTGGTISTTNADGVAMSNAGNTLTNNGSITTTGLTNEAVNSTGANAVITNNGSITTFNTGSTGIVVSGGGSSSVITNNGTMNLTGGGAFGISVETTGNTVVNNGSMSLSGSATASAINAISNSNVLRNTGTITTTVGNIDGIFMQGNTNTASNSGSITTSASGSDGMFANGTGNTLTNTGNITTAGGNADAMYATGSNNVLVNRGTLTTTGFNGDGLYGTGTNYTLTNYGTIRTSGSGSDGMYLAGTTVNPATNYGTIISTGSGYAITSSGTGAVIVNDGYVEGTTATAAIRLAGTGSTLRLMPNSRVVGNIEFAATGGTLEYDLSNAGNVEGDTLYSVSGNVTGTAPTVVLKGASNLEDAAIVKSGNSYAVISEQTFSGEGMIVSTPSAQAANLVTQRQQLAVLGKTTGIQEGTRFAANTSSVSDIEPAAGWGMAENKVFWTEGFGSYRERPEDGGAASSETRSGGVLVGLDLPEDESGYRYGVYAGGFAGEHEMGETGFRTIDSEGALAGGYIGRQWNAYYLSAQLAVGYAQQDSERRVVADIARADYDSFFVSPSLSVMRPFADVVDGAVLVPSLTLRYTGQYAESYSESGSTLDQDVDSRDYHTLGARAQMEAHLDGTRIFSGNFVPVLRAGVDGETDIGGNEVDLNVLGTDVSFDPDGGNDTVDAIIGANLSYALDAGPELYMDTEASAGLNKGDVDDNFGVTGRLGMRVQF